MRYFELKFNNCNVFVDLSEVVGVSVPTEELEAAGEFAFCCFRHTIPYHNRYVDSDKKTHFSQKVNDKINIPKSQLKEFLAAWKNEVPADGPYR